MRFCVLLTPFCLSARLCNLRAVKDLGIVEYGPHSHRVGFGVHGMSHGIVKDPQGNLS